MVISRQFERLFDLRTIRRNIRSGTMTKEKYDEYLRSLPDMADNIAPLSSMDDDGEGKPARGEGGGSPAPSFPRRTDVPILTGDDDDDIDDDDDDLDDDDDDADDEAPVSAAAATPVAATPAGPIVSDDAGPGDASGDAGVSDASGDAGGDDKPE